MEIVIRTDSSVQIGTGHVMRCLTLADELRSEETGVNVSFISYKLEGDIHSIIERYGFNLYPLSKIPNEHKETIGDQCHLDWFHRQWEVDLSETNRIIEQDIGKVDLLIVDHYGLDYRWEKGVFKNTKNLMVIDDLANRKHNCNILLDQNYYNNMEKRYKDLVPSQCKLLLGPNYSLIRPEFRGTRKSLRQRNGVVKNILIFFGGSDPTNETLKTIKAIEKLNRIDIHVNVVVGQANPFKKEIEELCKRFPNISYHCQINNISELMASADLAIGAGGSATWERCYLGVPTLTTIVADNQQEVTTALDSKGVIWNLGWYNKIGVNELSQSILNAINNPSKLKEMEKKSFHIMGNLTEKNELNVIKTLKKDLFREVEE